MKSKFIQTKSAVGQMCLIDLLFFHTFLEHGKVDTLKVEISDEIVDFSFTFDNILFETMFTSKILIFLE